MFLSKFILVKTGPLYILTCFENQSQVAATPMPQTYQNKMVWILCNDCGKTSEVNFHIVAHKCLKCKSYNTRQTQGGPVSYSSRIAERVYQDGEMIDLSYLRYLQMQQFHYSRDFYQRGRVG
ncbi:e3 ubiquitin-protein ligase rzfp34 [Quercus suber]|uniref:E3 ubiquitin-protein ligase rzfp34 n=1 Tax=Quercus suber TaxID=58331 RepID=A0AAW0KIG6_QUESU